MRIASKQRAPSRAEHLIRGAADDLTRVTEIARSMVTRYGMYDKLGHVAYQQERPSFLGAIPDAAAERNYSEETAREIDCAVREIVSNAFERSAAILTRNRAPLEEGARRLRWAKRTSRRSRRSSSDRRAAITPHSGKYDGGIGRRQYGVKSTRSGGTTVRGRVARMSNSLSLSPASKNSSSPRRSCSAMRRSHAPRG